MAPEEIAELLKTTFGPAILEGRMESGHPHVLVEPARWHEIALFLRDDDRMRFNMLRCITGVDRLADDQIEVIYDLVAMVPQGPGEFWSCDHVFAVKIRVPREGGHIPTVSDVWPAADWHEREAFDLLGVVFDNHPDPRRILLADDWAGYPLRKDYEYPLEYHGIPGTTEYGLKSPVH